MSTTETIEHRGQQFKVLFNFYPKIGREDREIEIISASVEGKPCVLTTEDERAIEQKLWDKHKEYVRKTLAGN